jgi:hypothetical protein
MLLETQQAAPNTGNFILLVLAVCGAVADNRYKAKGGKRDPKTDWRYLSLGVAIVLAIFVLLGYRGVSAGTLVALTGNLIVWAFAAYELRRLFVRRSNPVVGFKK